MKVPSRPPAARRSPVAGRKCFHSISSRHSTDSVSNGASLACSPLFVQDDVRIV